MTSEEQKAVELASIDLEYDDWIPCKEYACNDCVVDCPFNESMEKDGRTKARRDAIRTARAIAVLLNELDSGRGIIAPERAGRVVMRLSKNLYNFGLSLAEEKTAEDKKNAAPIMQTFNAGNDQGENQKQ